MKYRNGYKLQNKHHRMYPGERFNSYTHLIGAVGSLIGLIALVFVAVTDGDPWKIVSYSVYGVTMVTLYAFSTLYHSFKGKAKRIFQKLDHIAIYFLIAGTYTPFTLVALRGDIGWIVFGIVWGLALVGITIDLIQRNDSKRIIQLIIYLSMGWLAVFMAEPLLNEIGISGFYWLITGGLFYTAGVIFYVLDSRHRFAHGIWHLFVLAGSVAHFITIVQYV